jgi:hypothetical protein
MNVYYITTAATNHRVTFKVWTDESGEIVEVDIAERDSTRAMLNQNLLPMLNAETVAEMQASIRDAHYFAAA